MIILDDDFCDKQTVGTIVYIGNILKKHDVALPNVSIVIGYAPRTNDRGETDLWGLGVKDAEKLSILLNR